MQGPANASDCSARLQDTGLSYPNERGAVVGTKTSRRLYDKGKEQTSCADRLVPRCLLCAVPWSYGRVVVSGTIGKEQRSVRIVKCRAVCVPPCGTKTTTISSVQTIDAHCPTNWCIAATTTFVAKWEMCPPNMAHVAFTSYGGVSTAAATVS